MAVKATFSAPPPWHLKGNGFILPYYFSKQFLEQKGFMAGFQKNNLRWSLGAVLLMNYERADVGPYQELMFIPGLFSFKKWPAFSIAKIYVSSPESQLNGQQNWGIPKELASFHVEQLGGGRYRWVVKKDDKPFFDATIQSRQPGIPFYSRLVPWSRIVQEEKERLLLTTPTATGMLKPATVQHISADATFFPPIQEAKLLGAFHFREFKMKFPIPWHIG